LFATPPREAHGTSHTLNNNGYEHGLRFDVIGGPEFRMVVDFADLDGTETIMTTGQSGQPGSPHYSDMTEPWRVGRYCRLPFNPPAVESEATGTVHLERR
jgi:acyl-homoserine lactone acylase PvdQ